jgi:hypothetical protein
MKVGLQAYTITRSQALKEFVKNSQTKLTREKGDHKRFLEACDKFYALQDLPRPDVIKVKNPFEFYRQQSMLGLMVSDTVDLVRDILCMFNVHDVTWTLRDQLDRDTRALAVAHNGTAEVIRTYVKSLWSTVENKMSVSKDVASSLTKSIAESYGSEFPKSVLEKKKQLLINKLYNFKKDAKISSRDFTSVFQPSRVLWPLFLANYFKFSCKLSRFSSKLIEQLTQVVAIQNNCGMCYLTNDYILVCEKPITCTLDAGKMLHNSKAPALQYSDGWGMYCIHGCIFSKEDFEKSRNLTLLELFSWTDMDQRRALLADTPAEGLLKTADAVLIDETTECGGYKLWNITLPIQGRWGSRSTTLTVMTYKAWKGDKQYAKFVNPSSKNCLEAIASLRFLSVADYTKAVKS